MLATISNWTRGRHMLVAAFGLLSQQPFTYCDRALMRGLRTGVKC